MTADRPDRLRQLITSIQAPRALTTAGLRDRFGDAGNVEPTVGQVWRATWDDVSRLVLLVTVEDRRWRVVPVSVEPTGEDDRSLVIAADQTAFAVEVTAWAGRATSIPTGTLCRVIDRWSPGIVSWCADAASKARREPPAGTRPGRRITDPFDANTTIRARLTDDLDVLAAAPLVPTQTPASLDLRAAALSVGLRSVVAALALPQPTVMRIVQGKQPATPEQAQVLAGLFECTTEDIIAAAGGFPLELAVELEQPRWRDTWRSMARRLKVSEAAARLQVGFGTFAAAFRQTGGAGPDWRGRIEQWLAAHQDETGQGDS